MCGIVGMFSPDREVSVDIYDALTIIQHRGQDSAGIATFEAGKLHMRKENGMVRDVFREHHMEGLHGNIGIGHCRYPTAGTSACSEAQPFYVNSPYGIVLAHNGNLTNTKVLAEEVREQDHRHLNTDSDSEVLLNILAHELSSIRKTIPDPEDIFAAIRRVHHRCEGAYAVIVLISGVGLLAFRDPRGIRPLAFGTCGDEYLFSSESVAFTPLGFKMERDVQPGEAVFVDMRGDLHSMVCAEETGLHPCLFEFVYLARPESMIDEVSVYKSRLRMGDSLARKILREWPGEHIDVVVPIPDTSRTSALPIAHQLGVKYREGFIKNRYIGRTFIEPNQEKRVSSIRKKLNAIPLEFKDKNVLLVDDSIVRGNTSRKIVQMARDCGARKVFFASAAPPVRYQNVYGIDMPAAYELIAHDRTVAEVCADLGVDRLIFQDLEDLLDAVQQGNPAITRCDASCFDGVYVSSVTEQYLRDVAAARNDQAKQKTNEAGAPLEKHATFEM